MSKKMIWSKNRKRILIVLEDNYQYVFTTIPFIEAEIQANWPSSITKNTIKKYLQELMQLGYVKKFKNYIGETSYTITEKYTKDKDMIMKGETVVPVKRRKQKEYYVSQSSSGLIGTLKAKNLEEAKIKARQLPMYDFWQKTKVWEKED